MLPTGINYFLCSHIEELGPYLVIMLSAALEVGGYLRGVNVFGLSWLEWVGLLTTLALIIYQVPQYVTTLYTLWVAPILGHATDLRKMGKWAVVTGASDGIGKSYCEELARLGINIVLISRTEDKLKNVASQIEKEFQVNTKIIVADFTQGPHIYKGLEKELENLEVGVLVNNVGMWYPYAEFFMDLPNGDKYSQDMINCNVLSLTMMTRIVLRQMCPRKAGVIVNVGSTASLTPVPLMAVYSATKAYVERFSESLALEYKSQGIIIQTVIPCYVSTRMSRVSAPSFFSPSPQQYVQKALRTVGLESVTAVHIPHRLTIRAFIFARFFFPNLPVRFMFNFNLVLRSMKLKRKQARNKST